MLSEAKHLTRKQVAVEYDVSVFVAAGPLRAPARRNALLRGAE